MLWSVFKIVMFTLWTLLLKISKNIMRANWFKKAKKDNSSLVTLVFPINCSFSYCGAANENYIA